MKRYYEDYRNRIYACKQDENGYLISQAIKNDITYFLKKVILKTNISTNEDRRKEHTDAKWLLYRLNKLEYNKGHYLFSHILFWDFNELYCRYSDLMEK